MKKYSYLNILILLWCDLCFAEAVLLPWRTPGVDPEIIVKNKKSLDDAKNQLEKVILSQARPIRDFAKGSLTKNEWIALGGVMQGQEASAEMKGLAFEPVLCRVRGEDWALLAFSDLATDRLVGVVGSRVGSFAQVTFDGVWERVRNQIGASKGGSSLKLAIRSARPLTRADFGSDACLNLLLAGTLAQRYVVLRPSGSESYFLIKKLLTEGNPIRSNRTLVVHWRRSSEGLDLDYGIASSESVLGTPYSQMDFFPFKMKEDQVALNPALLEELKVEESMLDRNTEPQVSKVYGAWVYLDRGRAYGLRINDRLRIGEGGDIAGHVVGFFGAKLEILSPNGTPIREGAIVFIRKGQRLTKIGQRATYDSKKYPTPWPP